MTVTTRINMDPLEALRTNRIYFLAELDNFVKTESAGWTPAALDPAATTATAEPNATAAAAATAERVDSPISISSDDSDSNVRSQIAEKHADPTRPKSTHLPTTSPDSPSVRPSESKQKGRKASVHEVYMLSIENLGADVTKEQVKALFDDCQM